MQQFLMLSPRVSGDCIAKPYGEQTSAWHTSFLMRYDAVGFAISASAYANTSGGRADTLR